MIEEPLAEVPRACPAPWVSAYGGTDVGRVRAMNEDSHACLPDLGLFVVADGMGGAAAGHVASRLLVRQVRRAVDDGDTTWPSDTAIGTPESGARRLISGIHRANRRIFSLGQRYPRGRGMGTTFAGLLLLGRCALVAHVGDSRVYRLRDGALERLTRDHSYVEALVAAGVLTPEAAATSGQRHLITRAVGIGESVQVDTKIIDVRAGDVFLVSSDGLHGDLSDEEIACLLTACEEPWMAVDFLLAAANARGGADNITAVVARVNVAA